MYIIDLAVNFAKNKPSMSDIFLALPTSVFLCVCVIQSLPILSLGGDWVFFSPVFPSRVPCWNVAKVCVSPVLFQRWYKNTA